MYLITFVKHFDIKNIETDVQVYYKYYIHI